MGHHQQAGMGRVPENGRTVAVIYEDVTSGYRYADWFALHGYKPP